MIFTSKVIHSSVVRFSSVNYFCSALDEIRVTGISLHPKVDNQHAKLESNL